MVHWEIDPDIRKAETLPAAVYRDSAFFEQQRAGVFARSWQVLPEFGPLDGPGSVAPLTLLPGCIDEPLVMTRDGDGRVRCLSNVCTHRGAILVEEAGCLRTLRCRYHGRRFGLDGGFASMPEFEQAEGFPRSSDDLASLPLERLGPLWLTSLDPPVPFRSWVAPVLERTGFLEPEGFRYEPSASRDYDLDANWALYCDNYLEGFHIPFVHPGLNELLDYGSYRSELFDGCNLQIGIAGSDEACFELPAGHPDAGQSVAGYYFWMFPNTMLNFYPWGLSLNVVQPLGPDRTRISYRTYVRDATAFGRGAGSELHQVEMEDEAIVRSVQRGIRSRVYVRGRYSPTRETCVHHFHRLLTAALQA